MAIRRVKVMLSSRCRDAFPKGGPSLTQTRSELKAELEGISLLGEQLFDVWINELAPAAEGSQDSWDTCLREGAPDRSPQHADRPIGSSQARIAAAGHMKRQP
jgi:hypothetical protein